MQKAAITRYHSIVLYCIVHIHSTYVRILASAHAQYVSKLRGHVTKMSALVIDHIARECTCKAKEARADDVIFVDRLTFWRHKAEIMIPGSWYYTMGARHLYHAETGLGNGTTQLTLKETPRSTVASRRR